MTKVVVEYKFLRHASLRMRLDSFSMVLETNRDKKYVFFEVSLCLVFRTVRVDARCSKYDFWNPGKFLDRNRLGKIFVEQ